MANEPLGRSARETVAEDEHSISENEMTRIGIRHEPRPKSRTKTKIELHKQENEDTDDGKSHESGDNARTGYRTAQSLAHVTELKQSSLRKRGGLVLFVSLPHSVLICVSVNVPNLIPGT